MTPNDVQSARFGKPPIGKRGYDEQDVDDVLDRIEASLNGQPDITIDELSAVTFRKPPIGRRGYFKADVDSFIARVISEWPAPGLT